MLEHLTFDHLEVQSSPQPELCSDWLGSRIALIFSAYRRGDWVDPAGFTVQLSLNLQQFPRDIVEYVTDPVTGIQARFKWPPTLSEIVEACRAEIEHRTKVAKFSSLPGPAEMLPKPKFSASESYEAMFKKYGRPIGVFEEGRTIPYRG